MKCRHCSSTLIEIEPYRFKCTGDNIKTQTTYLDDLIDLELTQDESYNEKLIELEIENPKLMNMFLDYRRVKAKNKQAKLICPFNDTYQTKVYLDDSESSIPGPSDSIKIGDPVEAYLAEHMLGRKLSEDEMSGKFKIPKINQKSGDVYWDSISEIVWPHDCNTYNKSSEIDDGKSMVPVFNFKALKNKFKTPTIKKGAA